MNRIPRLTQATQLPYSRLRFKYTTIVGKRIIAKKKKKLLNLCVFSGWTSPASTTRNPPAPIVQCELKMGKKIVVLYVRLHVMFYKIDVSMCFGN
jgi:hypothetical protein